MKLQDIINADFANVIHDYKDIELGAFICEELTIKCIDGIQASNLVIDLQEVSNDLELDWDIKINIVKGSLNYFITIK